MTDDSMARVSQLCHSPTPDHPSKIMALQIEGGGEGNETKARYSAFVDPSRPKSKSVTESLTDGPDAIESQLKQGPYGQP